MIFNHFYRISDPVNYETTIKFSKIAVWNIGQ